MRSLRTKILLLNVIAVTVALLTATAIGVISIASFGHDSSEETLRLLCLDGKNSLNDYFDSVEQSANTIADLVNRDLQDVNLNDLTDHIETADVYFKDSIKNTDGVATYYYRFNPNVTDEDGFWYVDEGDGLKEHAVTPLSDVEEDACLWFYRTKEAGKATWLLPYDTDSLDSFWVVSYNVPVYKDTTFVGVVGIEIGYQTLGKQIKNIKALETGYAYVVENEGGTIVFHPYIDLLGIPEGQPVPKTPKEFVEGLKSKEDSYGGHHFEYSYDDFSSKNHSHTVKKHCYALTLRNEGMSVVVCVPLSEVNNL